MTTTRFLRQVAVLGLIAVLTVTAAQAQDGGGGRQRGGRGFGGPGGFGGGGGPGGMFGGPRMDRAAMLRIDKVRQELKIEEAQAATIDAALDAYNEQRNSNPRMDRDAYDKLSEEEKTAYREKSDKERAELSKKTDEILVALLEAPQVKRLDEVTIQARLSMSAANTLKADDIKSKLMITDEQVAKLDEVQKTMEEERQKAMQEAFANAGGQGGDREAMRAKMTEMMTAFQKKSTEAAVAVLNDDQKKSLEEMKGAPFELTMRDFMGGRGFGGPPGGGRDGGGRDGGRGNGGGGRPPAE
ncbi:MAG: Spy/CpxP family protein refolding chaperone [Planctomycetaceae bacterium]